MSYYILPKNNNNLIVNPQSNIDDCKLYSSYSLYNFYNVIQKQITDIFSNDSDLSINYEELIKIVNDLKFVSRLRNNTNIIIVVKIICALRLLS